MKIIIQEKDPTTRRRNCSSLENDITNEIIAQEIELKKNLQYKSQLEAREKQIKDNVDVLNWKLIKAKEVVTKVNAEKEDEEESFLIGNLFDFSKKIEE